MGILTVIKNRVYNDYLMSSRLDEYERIIKELNASGYEQLSVREYNKRLSYGDLEDKKYFINRHDIDTDVATAKEFFKIEKKYNAKATYYFRLSTVDIEFMKEIEEYGSEASYHFEEIAQYCKDKHIKRKEDVINQLDTIKNIFSDNFKSIELKLGRKLETVCSHGDFVNRKLELVNHKIVEDTELRKSLGIKCEAYDKKIMESFDIYISDTQYPKFYTPKPIFEYINQKRVICMLSHPRQWRTNILINSYDNLKRVYEGLMW